MTDAPTSSDRLDRPERSDLDRADELDVPPGAEVYTCDRCGERFPGARQRDLHRGLAHASDLTPAEREAYEAASAEENADLRRFRIVSLGLLVLLYFGFLMLYAVVGTG